MRFAGLTKGEGHTLVAARHNRREIQAERGAGGHIDPLRSHLNYSLVGEQTAAQIAENAKEMIANAAVVRPRKNAMRAVEFIFSLPPSSPIDHRAYFGACLDWTAANFGGRDLIVAADVHSDEAAPHLHVLLVPLRDGKLAGSALLGDRSNVVRLHGDFIATVASRFGLKASTAKLRGASREALAEKVIKALLARNDPAVLSTLWQSVRDAIAAHPEPFALMLGIELASETKSRRKSFVEIMTSTGKQTSEDREHVPYRDSAQKTIPYRKPGEKPFLIGLQTLLKNQAEKSIPYVSVDKGEKTNSASPPNAAYSGDSVRVRDDDATAEEWTGGVVEAEMLADHQTFRPTEHFDWGA
jgi:hypothetical protein